MVILQKKFHRLKNFTLNGNKVHFLLKMPKKFFLLLNAIFTLHGN